MRKTTLATAAALALLASPAFAVDVVLDFAGNICGAGGNQTCGDYSQIGQTYGDIAGVLDVAHESRHAASGDTYESFLKFWGSNYSNLTGVAWGGGGPAGYVSELRFTPGAGQQVTLVSLDFGDYANRNYTSSAQILDAGTQQVLWSSGIFNPDAVATTFTPGVGSSAGLVLRWGPDGYDVGVDNIRLSVTAVPEPGSWALLLAGAALLGWRGRNRRS